MKVSGVPGEPWKCPKCGALHQYSYELARGRGPLVEMCGACRAMLWTEFGQPRRLMDEGDLARLGPDDRALITRAMELVIDDA